MVKCYHLLVRYELVGIAEIQALLGVGRSRVDQLSRQRGFPEPVSELAVSRTRLWERSEIETWIADRKARQEGASSEKS